MNGREFASALREDVVEANLTIYRHLFEETNIADTTDAYWLDALTLFAQLHETQREELFRVVRQVMVDTTSNLLAILDGVSRLRNQKEALSLTLGEECLDGDLQDHFLELEERARA